VSEQREIGYIKDTLEERDEVGLGANDDVEGVETQVVSTLLTSSRSIQCHRAPVHFPEWERRADKFVVWSALKH